MRSARYLTQDFRIGFEAGYRNGYERFRANRRVGPSLWSRGGAGVGSQFGYGGNERDLALNNGFNDGYEEGLSDGRNRHRDDPTAESRYRNADRGYDRWYGARGAYRTNYRRAFIKATRTDTGTAGAIGKWLELPGALRERERFNRHVRAAPRGRSHGGAPRPPRRADRSPQDGF